LTIRPANIVFWLYQYATFTEPVTLKNSDGTVIDLTGCTAALDARRDITDVDPVFRLTTENGGITIVGSAPRTMQLNLNATSTGNLDIDPDGECFYYDLLLKSADGVTVQRSFQGVIVAMPGVTRPPT